jgi:hypothetical protein
VYLLLHVRRSAADFETARAQIDGIRGVQRSHVRIAAIEAVIEAVIEPFLDGVLAAFHHNHRLVSYEVQITGSVEVANAVTLARADLGLTLNAPPSSRLVQLGTMPYFLHAFVDKAHPLASRLALQLSDCIGFPVAVGDETLGGRQRLERAFEQTLLDFRPFLASNSIALMMEIGTYSDAICFQALPRRERREVGKLVSVPLADRRVGQVQLALVASKRRALLTAAVAAEFARAMRVDSSL